MFPRPPFGWELSEAQEIAAFETLKPRLVPLWNAIFSTEEEPYTSVVVPSMTLDREELENIPGATFYEERLLFLLIRLRNPRARMVYVTSQPVHPMVLEYYLQFLAGSAGEPRADAADHARGPRRHSPSAHREDPRASSAHPADPRLDLGSPARVPDGLQRDAAGAKAGGAARHPDERPRSEPLLPRHQVRQPEGVSRGRGSDARRLRGPPAPSRTWNGHWASCSASAPGSAGPL